MNFFLPIKKIYFVLEKFQRVKINILIILTFIAVILETLSFGLIIPLVGLILSPETFSNSSIFSYVLKLNHILKFDPLVNMLLIVLFAFTIKNIFLVYFTWYQQKLVNNILYFQTQKLFNLYLKQEYVFHLTRNISELFRNIFSAVNSFQAAILSYSVLISEIMVIISLSLLLLFFEPVGTLVCMFISIILVMLFYNFSKKKLFFWGKERMYHSEVYVKHIFEGIGGLKEIKILAAEEKFLSKFNKHMKKYAEYSCYHSFLTNSSKIFLEYIVIILLISLIVVTMFLGYQYSNILSIVGVFVAIAFRYLPAINRVIYSLQSIKGYQDGSNIVYEELKNLRINEDINSKEKINFNKKIVFEDVNFKYPSSNHSNLSQINFTINKGDFIGVTGITGSGKSTLINLLLGLLKPSTGKILVDEINISNNLRNWQQKIGYVPQNIYLTDDTIKKNIALGVDEEQIDEKKINEVLKMSHLSNFIYSLDNKIETKVGERGVRMSGGQLQRIGIARALYRNAEIIVLDEATSSLDSITEEEIMRTIENFISLKTIVVVSHRPRCIKKCSKIINLNNGKITNT